MTKIKCPVCAATNPPERKECAHCGAPLPRVRLQSSGEKRQSGPAPEVPGQLAFRKGDVIAKRYTVLDLVGKGGMGCIYKVHDTTLKEDVALKMLLPQYLRDKLVVERFFNEARIARQLSHPNIVRVHDIGIADRVLYISMEFLPGRSLRSMLDELIPGERLPVRTTLQIMIKLCEALEYAHQYTIHRDIKPENVMILPDGTVKLMDFGISKLMTSNQLTATAVIMGTPHYMSPEQLRDSRAVDARADIYSIGVMLYEILTGNLPTGVPKPASQIMKEIPPALDPIVAKCVEPDPMNRYQSAAELRQALEAILATLEGASAHVAHPPARAHRWSLSWLRPAIGVAMSLVILGLTGVGVLGLEMRRTALIEATASKPPENAAPARINPDERTLRWLLGLLDELGPRTDALQLAEDMKAVLERGHELGKSARQGGLSAAEAVWRARHALQCYTAVLAPRDGMFFVMPGNGESEGGFYMLEEPVSLGSYSRWASDSQWRNVPPPVPASQDRPVVGIRFYDALAYASAHGLQLPTRGQWQRAFAADARRMASGIYEMTRTLVHGDVPAAELPDFDWPADIVTMAVQLDESGEPAAILESALPFYQADAAVGFRCVLDAPVQADGMAGQLARQ